MTHANYILPIITSAIIGVSVYALTPPTPSLQEQAEIESQSKLDSCMSEIREEMKFSEKQKIIRKCSEIKPIILLNVEESTGTHSTGITVPPPKVGYTSKHTLILSGSHDYTSYDWIKGAGRKNNNPSGLTWGVSHVLKGLWDEAGIKYVRGTARPAHEKGYYIRFASVEDGLRAKIIAIRERWGKATVSHYLAGWGTDHIKLSFDKSKRISELSESEFMELFVNQLKKETPGYVSQLVKDKILVIK